MIIPFNDLNIIHKIIKKEVLTLNEKTISKNSFILSDEIKVFEENFAKFSNCKFSISCSNGTDALTLVLNAIKGNEYKNEVLVPVNSFIATAFSVTSANLKPVFYDCNDYYLANSSELESKISNKTLAIIGVNLFGQLVDLKSMKSVSRKYNIPLIIDGAQSHGAFQNNSVSEDISLATTYSFYPGKNLGAWGDGGAVNTNSKRLAEKISILSNQGSKEKYKHIMMGTNSRLNSFQANVLLTKLKYLKEWIEQRNEIAEIYYSRLRETNPEIILPKVFNGNYHTYHLFVIQVREREKLIKHLNSNGIQTGIHYPNLITDSLAFKNHKQYRTNFQNASLFKDKILSLPIYPGMSKHQVDYVALNISNFYK